MENKAIYNQCRVCPKDAQRIIQGGNLKGKTDINPQWRIEKLTEMFGPVGFGWRTSVVRTWTEQADGESCAWVLLELFVKDPETGEWSQAIQGLGGSKQNGKGKGDGINDEAFKMAETDAISVACKKLGMAADIYWEQGSTKYSGQESRKRLTTDMLQAGELNTLIDWLAKYPEDSEAWEAAKQQIRNGYYWESHELFDKVVSQASKKSFINDLHGE